MNKVEAILKVIKSDLIPVTAKGVEDGGHVFGGLVLNKDTLETVVAGTNNRQVNPIYHGEIDTIQKFFALKDRPKPEDCIFVASHEPCSMCISAIAWSGFKEVWVLFGAETMGADFDMPVDMIMYKEVFGVDGANTDNLFFKKYSLSFEAKKQDNAEYLKQMLDELDKEYAKFNVKDFVYPGM